MNIVKTIPANDMEHSSVPIDLFSWTAAGDSDPAITVKPPRKLVADKYEGFGIVPIGFIGWWYKDLTGVPDLPDGWIECNGQVLDDTDSPLHGQPIPDINGNLYFIRGGATSGATQEDQLQGFQIGCDEDTTGAREYWGQSGSRDNIVQITGLGNNTYPRLETTAQGSSRMLIPKNDGTNGDPRMGDETRPPNITMVAIMRVK